MTVTELQRLLENMDGTHTVIAVLPIDDAPPTMDREIDGVEDFVGDEHICCILLGRAV